MDTGLEAAAITCRLTPRGRVHLADDDLGLSRVPCYALAQDTYGRLWVGTEDGPVTFDGLVWASQAAVTGTSGCIVHAFAADDAGVLWMASDRDGVFLIDTCAVPCRVIAHLTTVDGLPSNNVYALHDTPDGALLVGTDAGLALVRSRRVESCITLADGDRAMRDNADVRAVVMDRHHIVWAGTMAGLVALRGPRLTEVRACTGTATGRQADPAVRGLVAHDGGVLAALADDTVVHATWLDEAPQARIVARAGSGLRVLAHDRRGHLWVGSGSDVTVLDGVRPCDQFSSDDGLPGRGVWAVLCSDEDRVWAATSAGLVLLQGPPHPVRAVSPGPSSHESPVYAIAHDRRGRTWIAGEDGLVILDGDRRVALPQLPAELASETSWTLATDPRGSMWVGTRRDGALRVDGDTGRVLERHAAGHDVPSLAIACDRYLWACVTGGGLLVVDLTGREPPRRVTAADGLPDDRALCVGAAGDAVIAGGWRGWVAVLDAARATVRDAVLLRGPAEGRPVTDVAPIPGDDSSVWVSSYGGGLLDLDLRALVVRRVVAADGTLPSDLVYACRVDGRGHVWAGTRHGLVRLAPDSGHTIVIGRSLGLPSEECNGQALTLDERGRVWIGTVRGAAMINAPTIRDVVPPCPIYLAALRVMGQDRPITDDVMIEDTEYDVVFAYGAVDYTAPAQVHYRVRLQGLDPDWSRPSAQRSTRYTNLACGAYTFLVQARNWGGTWSDSAALHFVVTRSAQGRELDAARAQAEAAEAARAQAEAGVRVRNEVLASVTHDLRAPLTSIMGRAELLTRVVDRPPPLDPTRLRDHITALSAAATRMAGMIGEITDVMQLDMGQPLALTMTTVDLAAVIDAATATVGLTRGPDRAAIEVAVEPGLTVRGDAARLMRVVDNIVSNAVKYSPTGGQVTVTARAQGSDAVIVVQDQGVGIPADEVSRIFTPYFRASTAGGAPGTGLGLAGARAIVEQHGGAIQLHSVEGEGTTFTLTLPLGEVSPRDGGGPFGSRASQALPRG